MPEPMTEQPLLSQMSVPALTLADLAVTRGGMAVLEGVNVTVMAGRALILRGANGIGKTTLLRTIAGLQPALRGEVVVAQGGACDSIAYAAHSDGLKTTLTTRENLAFWAATFGTDLVDVALDHMNLRALESRFAMNLSAGQKRRLGLARLLVTGRPIWVLDEPTVSLDAASVALFVQAVRAHLGRGGAAVLATHIDLGLEEADTLDLTPFKARPPEAGGLTGGFDEAFT